MPRDECRAFGARAPPDPVEDGRAALTELSLRPYDLVISDLKMPNMGGIELLDQLDASQAGSPAGRLVRKPSWRCRVCLLQHLGSSPSLLFFSFLLSSLSHFLLLFPQLWAL